MTAPLSNKILILVLGAAPFSNGRNAPNIVGCTGVGEKISSLTSMPFTYSLSKVTSTCPYISLVIPVYTVLGESVSALYVSLSFLLLSSGINIIDCSLSFISLLVQSTALPAS